MSVIATAGSARVDDALPDATFEAIAVPDAGRLYSLALSILRDEGEAEDAVQETLLKARRSWESVARLERPAAWLTLWWSHGLVHAAWPGSRPARVSVGGGFILGGMGDTGRAGVRLDLGSRRGNHA